MAQWSWIRAAGNSAALTVWSGWWWLNTTSVTSPGAGPRGGQRGEQISRAATIPGSTTMTASPSRMSVTVLPTF